MGSFRNWHWATKLIVGLGLPGSGLLWLTDDPSMSGAALVEPISPRLSASSESAITSSETMADPALIRQLSPVTHFSVMVERPLFDPSRRALAAEDDLGELEHMAEEPGKPIVAFVGTIVDGYGIRAVVSGRHGVRGVLIGEQIDGWDIVGIEARRLILSRGDEEIELTILVPN